MSTKAASRLAFLGMLVLTVLLVRDLVRDIPGFLRDILPLVQLVRELVYTFASLTVTVFFFVYYKRRS